MSDDKPTEPDATEASDEKEGPDAEAEASRSSDDESARKGKTPTSKKRRARERAKAEAAAAAAAAAKKSSGNSMLFGAVGLAAGLAVGWFGHIAQAKAKLLKADTAPAPAASGSAGPAEKTGPCAALEKALCTKTGENSAPCMQAKTATALLTSGTCEVALDAVPAMIEKVKAARAPCDSLVARLCKDLTPMSPACAMVKEKTPSFPPERCAELNKNYEQVLAELKQMEEHGALPGTPGAVPQGMPPGQPGMPPGAAPNP